VPTTSLSPSLAIKRILLFTNKDFGDLFGSYNNPFNNTGYPGFRFRDIENNGSIFNESWYQSSHSSWDAYVLKHVYLDQDYSLCRNYHQNINVSSSGADVLTSPATVQSNISSGLNYSSSGKLSLNRILTYEYHNVKLTPSIKFEYGRTLPDYNPDFNPIKADYWGYYKSDATTNGYSRYTNSNSSDGTQAWSLSGITDPLGGKQEILYESNTYNRVIDMESPDGVRGAVFIYRIKHADKAGTTTFSLTMEEDLQLHKHQRHGRAGVYSFCV
jgi:hypothetical protein